jgi:hypothetical protein
MLLPSTSDFCVNNAGDRFLNPKSYQAPQYSCRVTYPETSTTYKVTYIWYSSTQEVSKTTYFEREPQTSSTARLESFDNAETFLDWVFLDAHQHFNGAAPAPQTEHQGESCHYPPSVHPLNSRVVFGHSPVWACSPAYVYQPRRKQLGRAR